MLATARRIVRFRGLLLTLTARELKARYRGSVLGFFWSLVNPLLLLGVYSFVFAVAFVPQRGASAQPYALFLVTGLFPWIWASGSLLEGVVSLHANAGLIKKAVFPAELLPLVSVLANGVHFLLALPILAGALVLGRALGHPVGGWSALGLPAVVLLELFLLAGLALALAALHAHFRDVRDILANLLTLLFFLTPILYPLDALPAGWVRRALAANPFTPFTLAYQQLLFSGELPAAGLWLQMAVLAALAWALGSFLFERLRETLVEAV
jgi:ABC-type polysaccharide/polyol phosphate export permease